MSKQCEVNIPKLNLNKFHPFFVHWNRNNFPGEQCFDV
jgi:hypothetical protein